MLAMPSIPLEAPPPALQVIGESSLAHHLDLHDHLADRRRGSRAYRALLEDVLGFSLERAVVSTSEHAAPFNFASSVSYALPQWAIQRAGFRPEARVVILVGTLVPFDNRHYPRGFALENGPALNLFSNRLNKSCAMLQPPVNVETRNVELRKESKPFLAAYPWLRPLLTGGVAFPDAGHQMGAIMEAIASHWFEGPCPVTIRSIEEVTCQMLVRLIEARDPWMDRLLFDATVRHAMARSLMGTFCAWGARHGSFLFWNRRGERLGRFVEEDACLVDGEVRVPITRAAVLEGLVQRTILPGAFLALLVTSYLPGLAVAGGPRQPEYYVKMIRAANEVLGLTRGEELSTYGYWTVDLSKVTPRADEPKCIPSKGAGLWLTRARTDAAWLCDQLSRCPVLPIPPPSPYD